VHHAWPQLIFTRLRPHSDRQCSSHDLAAPIAPELPGVGIGLASATLAHELGHACGLLHDNFLDCAAGDTTNLMYCKLVTPDGFFAGDNLSPFQRAIVRSSPHVTYL
jgi:hypothetical protein